MLTKGTDRVIETDLSSLKGMIKRLQAGFEGGGFGDAIAQLSRIDGFTPYRTHQYPPLVRTENFDSTVHQEPVSLAEAFIWKQGDWLKYQAFSSYYARDSPVPDRGLVHYAFAKHLRDPQHVPIFDQNSLRAVWAICPLLKEVELRSIEAYLTTKAGSWKSTGGGAQAATSMEAFSRVMKGQDAKPGSLSAIDKLLMPLGSFLKSVKPRKGDTPAATLKWLRDCPAVA